MAVGGLCPGAKEAMSGTDGATVASVIWTMTVVSLMEVQGSSAFDYNISSNGGHATVNAILGGLSCKMQTPFVARLVDEVRCWFISEANRPSRSA